MSKLAHLSALQSLCREAALPDAGNRRDTISIRMEYELPPCFPLSDSDERRLCHADLDDLTIDELQNEALRLRIALAFGDLRSPSWAANWLRERLSLCLQTMRKQDL